MEMNQIELFRIFFYSFLILIFALMIYIIHAFSSNVIKNISSSLALLIDAMSIIILGFLIIICLISIFNPKHSAWFYVKIGLQGLYMTIFTFVSVIFYMIFQAPYFCSNTSLTSFSLFPNQENMSGGTFAYQIIQFIIVFATLLYIDKKTIPTKFKIVPYILSLYFSIQWIANGQVNTLIQSLLYIIYVFIFIYLIYLGFKVFI